MLRPLLLALLIILPAAAATQPVGQGHDLSKMHAAPAAPASAQGPREPGQAAFAAIQEIVEILDADPATDWSKVDVEALRRHLIDMDNVTLHAQVAATPVAGGLRYVVSGEGAVRDSIRRMTKAHAQAMRGSDRMTVQVEDAPGGVVMTVTVADPADLPRLKGLGFIGLLTLGMHHQAHHLMIASGQGPHP